MKIIITVQKPYETEKKFYRYRVGSRAAKKWEKLIAASDGGRYRYWHILPGHKPLLIKSKDV